MTKELCNEVCVEPTDRDACPLPRVTGPCEGYYPRDALAWFHKEFSIPSDSHFLDDVIRQIVKDKIFTKSVCPGLPDVSKGYSSRLAYNLNIKVFRTQAIRFSFLTKQYVTALDSTKLIALNLDHVMFTRTFHENSEFKTAAKCTQPVFGKAYGRAVGKIKLSLKICCIAPPLSPDMATTPSPSLASSLSTAAAWGTTTGSAAATSARPCAQKTARLHSTSPISASSPSKRGPAQGTSAGACTDATAACRGNYTRRGRKIA